MTLICVSLTVAKMGANSDFMTRLACVCVCMCMYVFEHGAGGRQSNRKERLRTEVNFSLKYTIQVKPHSEERKREQHICVRC